MKPTRKRPGQKTMITNAVGPLGYNLAGDKNIRARAGFEGLSLGKSASLYFSGGYKLDPGYDYIHKERFPKVKHMHVSRKELDIIFAMAGMMTDYDHITHTPLESGLIKDNPELYELTKKAGLARAKEQLAIAKRARETPSELSAVRELDSQPRYTKLGLSEDLEAALPY